MGDFSVINRFSDIKGYLFDIAKSNIFFDNLLVKELSDLRSGFIRIGMFVSENKEIVE